MNHANMKLRLFAIGSLFFLLFGSASSQVVNHTTDTLYSYAYNIAGDSVLTEKVIRTRTDSVHLYETRIWLSWDAYNAVWKAENKHDWVFDDAGHQLLFEKAHWYGSQGWVSSSRDVEEYSETGNLILKARYVWDDDWRGDYKHEYYQDAAGNDTLQVYSRWNLQQGHMEYSDMYRTAYDQDNYRISRFRYSWYNGQWVSFEKVYYEYIIESDGSRVTEIRTNGDPDETTWTFYTHRKTIWTYDERDRMLSEVLYTGEPVEWTEYTKQEFRYNDMDQTTFHSIMHWDPTANDWEKYHKYAYAFNADGKISLELSWSSTENQWSLPDSTEYFYDGNGRDSLIIYWDQVYMDTTYYMKKKIIFIPGQDDVKDYTFVASLPVAKLKLYPVPVSDFLLIESEVSVSHVELMDLNGRIVFSSAQVEGGLDLSSLAGGIYLLRLSNRSGKLIATRKILKE
jgi:Secretion system C-terminal sorting domain